MSFDVTGFVTHRGKGAPGQHQYVTTDALATVTASGYFNSIATSLQAKDEIFVVASDVTAVLRVAAITSGVVTTAQKDNNFVYVTGKITDISTAGSSIVVAPCAGKIVGVHGVLEGAIATADAVITGKIDGTAITGLSITVATASSAKGDKDSGTPTAANTVAQGDMVEIITSGASTNTVAWDYLIVIQPTLG